MAIYNDSLAHYITKLFAPHDPVLQQIYEAIPQRGLPAIAIKPEEGRFLQFLVGACGARTVVEIGTLGGYSGVWLARGLPADGRLITIEKEPKHAEVAREHFALAGLAERVDLRLGDAHDLLPRLSREGPFGFCFIDADKLSYGAYLDWALANVRRGGVIAAHNAFRGGEVLNRGNHAPEVEYMRGINQRFADDPRLLSTIFPAGDGMLVGVVR
ncbi:MAG TPA: O-methyltransferase [Anaerolineales bacterium]|nr:O-methyltransferase [Anaerolineales bacterium]